MRYETLKRVMESLAGVAEAVGNLRALLPVGMVDGIASEVNKFSGTVLSAAMLVDTAPTVIISPSADAFNGGVDESSHAAVRKAGLLPVSARPKAAKPKRAYVRKDKLGDPTGPKGAPAKHACSLEIGANDKPTPLCIVCGQPYTKTSNVQKRCPECRLKGLTKSKNPAATPDRLAIIKAVDKKLDTIPE